MKSLRDIDWKEDRVIEQALRAYRFNLRKEIREDPPLIKAYAERIQLITGLLEDGK